MNRKNNYEEYESISPTAIVTSYPRIFTDIPYEQEIYESLSKKCTDKVELTKNFAPEIEARYKLINKLLNESKIYQVLELAAGYTSRGLIYSEKNYSYVEMDLAKVVQNKKEILKEIANNIPKTLNIVSGNALNWEDFKSCEKYFDEKQPIAIINEGLLRYLTFDEKRIVALNIYQFLKKHGGVWITSDVTPKGFIEKQNKALPNFNKGVSDITSRNNLNDRFENIEHVKEFFGEIGFEITEIHPFSEMLPVLFSVYHNNIINENIEKSLEKAIVVVMKIKE